MSEQVMCEVLFEVGQLLVAHRKWREQDVYIVVHKGTNHQVASYTALHVAVNFAQYANDTFDFDGVVEKIVNNQDVSAWIPIHNFLCQKKQHPAFAHDYWNNSTVSTTTKEDVKRAVNEVKNGQR